MARGFELRGGDIRADHSDVEGCDNSLVEGNATATVGCSMTLKELALRMRCSRCGKKAAEVVAVARPRPRGVPKNPH
jgi:hypothetical protein